MIYVDKNLLKSIIIHKDIIKEDNTVPEIPKSSVREIFHKNKFFYSLTDSPEWLLVQNNILNNILKKIEINNSAVAFRKNLSYLNFFEPHLSSYYFVRFDIKSFFHSIAIEDIKKTFSPYFSEDYIDEEKKQTIIDAFLEAITYSIPNDSKNEKIAGKKVLPMGFITSPAVSNIVFRKLDILIQKLCSRHKIIYSRYADDLFFSSPKDSSYVFSESFENEISIILNISNLKLNRKKTIKNKNTISLNGYVLQHQASPGKPDGNIAELRISRKKTAIIEKLIYETSTNKIHYPLVMKTVFGYKMIERKFKYRINRKFWLQFNKSQLANRATGYRSYLISVLKFNEKYRCISNDRIEKYKHLIDELDNLIVKICNDI
ncbi:reverse transcriptase family protein [Serratia liquefaciens]|uniref:reverse transcriptase family protein n=1 Tax=Serratia liquefaciens TaxID=614 RepID=UPI003EC82710